MVTVVQLRNALGQPGCELVCQQVVNLVKEPGSRDLVTQAAPGRHLRPLKLAGAGGAATLKVMLCEDDYPGWVAVSSFSQLQPAAAPYRPVVLERPDIAPRLEAVIAFTQRAMAVPHEYLWGGTVAPNYDCSGLMQAAFAAAGIAIPRDAYQQEAFCDPVSLAAATAGDLIFFGTPERTTHVGLCLGQGRYIHSSGKDQGRNGIGIDAVADTEGIGGAYARQLKGAGRICRSYWPAYLSQAESSDLPV